MQHFDHFLAETIAAWRPTWIVAVSRVVAELSEPWVISLVVIVTALILLRRGYLQLAVAGVLMALVPILITKLLKLAVGRPRPPQLVTGYHPGGSSFPSTHATAAAAAALAALFLVAALANHLLYRAGILAACLVVIIATNRLILGAHYFTDVLAGCAVALLWGALVWIGVTKRPAARANKQSR